MMEERLQILRMLHEQKISVDEAEKLLNAISNDGEKGAAASENQASPRADSPKNEPKYFRVVVQDDGGDGKKSNVNVKIPFKLVRAGLKLAAFIPDPARSKVNDALKAKGLNLDLEKIRAGDLEDLVAQLNDFEVTVDDESSKVRIFCE